MSDLVKQYDVPICTEYIKPNEAIDITITDELKKDIETQPNRNEIIMSIVAINESVPLGFNYTGYDGQKKKHHIRIFYFNPVKDAFKTLTKGKY